MLWPVRRGIANLHQTARYCGGCRTYKVANSDPEGVRKVIDLLWAHAGIDVCNVWKKVHLVRLDSIATDPLLGDWAIILFVHQHQRRFEFPVQGSRSWQ
jgi:hypothetical protein